ncbi:MAG: MFS transporter [Candidatus Uhrbacteria bacterium]
MQLFHLHYTLRRLLRSDLRRFDFAIWTHTFGQSLVSIFVPIFLLRLGYSIESVIWFFIIYNAIDVPLNLVARWMVWRIGAIRTIMVGLVFEVLFFVLLFSLGSGNWPLLIIIAAAAAAFDVCYWVAHIYFFMRVSPNNDNVSGDTSMLEIMRSVAGILAPAIGAMLFIFIGQRTLIAVSAVIISASILPLLSIRHTSDRPAHRPKTIRVFFTSLHDARAQIVRALFSVHGAAEGVIWPLFIYMTFTTIESVALVPIIVSLTTIVFMYIAGRMEHRWRTASVVIGAASIAVVWGLRLVVDNTIFYYVSIFLVGFFAVLVTIPTDSCLFEEGERKDALTASTYRNLFGMLMRLVFFVVLAILTDVFHVSFLTAAMSLLALVAVVVCIRAPSIVSRPRTGH